MRPTDPPALLAPEPGPTTLKARPWGGTRLARLRHAIDSAERPIGESWEFSTLPNSESRSEGMALSARLGRPLPFLVKLIDTARTLSVQVHPDDDRSSGIAGKEEGWVVIDADRGARVWAGVRAGVDKAQFTAAVRQAVADPRRGAELFSLLQSTPVETGTVLIVPARTVHAIGPGILLAEIQQPTNCTHRLFDHGSDRELHVDVALAVTRIEARALVWQPTEVPARLRGKHLTLEVVGPGADERVADRDELLVPHGEPCVVWVAGKAHPLRAGELRLVTPGLRYRIDGPPRAGVVIGSIGPPGSRAGA